MKRFVAIATIAAATIASAVAQEPAACQFHQVNISNSEFTNVADNNKLGHYVGTYALNGKYRSFFNNGSMHEIAAPKAQQTEARGLNNKDQITGDFFDASLQRQRAFVYAGGKYTVFDFPGAAATIASAINDSGVIVGQYYTSNGIGHGFVRANGKIVALNFPGAATTWATGINNAGQISGVWQDNTGANLGFLYSSGKFTSLKFPGADDSSALGVGPDGTVVGNYFKAGKGHGFLYKSGVYKDATYPGATLSTIPVGYNAYKTLTGSFVSGTGKSLGFVAHNCQ
jgi:hypothetical protein